MFDTGKKIETGHIVGTIWGCERQMYSFEDFRKQQGIVGDF